MKDFVRSLRFKILIGILTVMLGFMIQAIYSGGTAPLLSQIISMVTVPVQSFSAGVAGEVTGFFDKFLSAGALYEQNQQMQAEINELRNRVVDYEKVKHENEQFREIIGVKENRPDITFEIASVIARDPADRFYSFTIDRGSLDDIKRLDPVMTADGLVGYVSEVGLNSAKVITILDVAIDVGAYDSVGAYNSATRDIGIVTGTIALAAQGMCQMEYLPRDSQIKAGDIVLTSGGSLFPKDILIGEVVEVQTSSHGTSLVATIRPAAGIQTVKDVVVITHFEGQGEK